MPLVLIRHPKPHGVNGLCYGRSDVALAPDAARDIGTIAARIATLPLTRLWTSPALRCRMLADAVSANTGVAALEDPRLQELDFGAWELQRWDKIPRAALDLWAATPESFAPPGGETGAALIARMTAFYDDIARHDGMQMVITHGGPLKILRALAYGEAPNLLAQAPAFGAVEVIDRPAWSVPDTP
jgi:alpha-ribazole phosphatase